MCVNSHNYLLRYVSHSTISMLMIGFGKCAGNRSTRGSQCLTCPMSDTSTHRQSQKYAAKSC